MQTQGEVLENEIGVATQLFESMPEYKEEVRDELRLHAEIAWEPGRLGSRRARINMYHAACFLEYREYDEATTYGCKVLAWGPRGIGAAMLLMAIAKGAALPIDGSLQRALEPVFATIKDKVAEALR